MTKRKNACGYSLRRGPVRKLFKSRIKELAQKPVFADKTFGTTERARVSTASTLVFQRGVETRAMKILRAAAHVADEHGRVVVGEKDMNIVFASLGYRPTVPTHSEDQFDQFSDFRILPEMLPPAPNVANFVNEWRATYKNVDSVCPVDGVGGAPWCQEQVGTFDKHAISRATVMRVASFNTYAGDDGIKWYLEREIRNRPEVALVDSQRYQSFATKEMSAFTSPGQKTRWCKHFSHRTVVAFRNVNQTHWQALAVDTVAKTIRGWDSFSDKIDPGAFTPLKRLYTLCTGQALAERPSEPIQGQFNGSDCGIHTLVNLLCYIRRMKPPPKQSITHDHINNVRTHVSYILAHMK